MAHKRERWITISAGSTAGCGSKLYPLSAAKSSRSSSQAPSIRRRAPPFRLVAAPFHRPLNANSGGRRNDDPERGRCVRSAAARKRAARRYPQWGLAPLSSLLRRETEEYDRVRSRLFSCSSSEASSSRSRTSLPPLKRGLEELAPVKMKLEELEEPEAEAAPERRAGVVVGPEDFLSPTEADNLLPAVLARSAREVEEDQQLRQREEEIDTVLYE
ncbi:hypothetical protein D1007_44576 [Hordeum vulgare]|nr:hypothetical protein D1007_44576 [Hordeum vulgare]